MPQTGDASTPIHSASELHPVHETLSDGASRPSQMRPMVFYLGSIGIWLAAFVVHAIAGMNSGVSGSTLLLGALGASIVPVFLGALVAVIFTSKTTPARRPLFLWVAGLTLLLTVVGLFSDRQF